MLLFLSLKFCFCHFCMFHISNELFGHMQHSHGNCLKFFCWFFHHVSSGHFWLSDYILPFASYFSASLYAWHLLLLFGCWTLSNFPFWILATLIFLWIIFLSFVLDTVKWLVKSLISLDLALSDQKVSVGLIILELCSCPKAQSYINSLVWLMAVRTIACPMREHQALFPWS